MPDASNETWMIYAKKQGVSAAKAQEYWDTAKESSKDKQDFQYIMGTFKQIIANSKKNERVVKEAEDKKGYDDKDIEQFITYAKNEGLDKEDQAKAIFFQVRGGIAKDANKEVDELGGEEMGKLWGAYKDAVKKALESKKESFINLSKNYLIEGKIISKGAKLIIK